MTHDRIVNLDGRVVVATCSCGTWTSRLSPRSGVMVLAEDLWRHHLVEAGVAA